jgi:hypothetical protein
LESLREKLSQSRDILTTIWRPVDVEKVARSRQLEQRGHEDGTREFPASDAVELSALERQVVGDVCVERDRSLTALLSHLRAYRDALSRLQTAMDVAGMRQDADDAVRRLKEIRAEWSGRTRELRNRATDAAGEFREFREREALRRGPRLPKDRGLSIATLIVLGVTESVLNGTFFAAGSDNGLLGGVALALAISGINISVGTLNGFVFLRMTHRRSLPLACVGMLGFAASLMAAVVFNAFVAHYRDAYQATGDATSTTIVWHGLLSNPFDLVSLQSWLLLALGLLSAGVAVWKGYALDDPYPGYGGQERRRAAAARAYNQHRVALVREAAEINEEYSENARDAIESLRGASAERDQIKGARARCLADYELVEADLENAGRQLLAIYREANLKARSTAAPAYFRRGFDFPDRGMNRPHVSALTVDQGLEHDANSLVAELDTLRAKVTAEHDVALAAAPPELPD